MAARVEVEGADRLAATLARARADLADTTAPDREAADLVIQAARPPVRSGWLARSGTVQTIGDQVTASWTAAYAGVIHNGWAARHIRPRPWIPAAIATAETPIVAVYARHTDQALNRVTGK